MKRLLTISLAFALLFGLSNCKKDSDEETPQPSVSDPATLLVYESDGFNKSLKTNQLQATVKKTDLQFSTFGDMNSGATFGSFQKAYVYNTAENTESFVLFDEMGEPAFLYKIDLTTGEKKESVVEFERVDQNNFYVRFFYYDWTNRLGTLLFETKISGSAGAYQSTPTFTIDNLNFGSKEAPSNGKKGNNSFPVRLSRLDTFMNPDYHNANSRSVNDGIDGWMDSFNKMRNSSIADWLSTSRKAGVVLTLAGLGLSETVIGAPVGVWLVAGGSCLVATSTAIEVVVTDKWSNFLTETKSKLETLSETAQEIAGNTVQKFQGYAHDLKEHWVNNSSKTDLDELIEEIEKEELLVNDDDLDDLPDKNGVLQIGLSWSTDGTDVDLWVTDPAGETIDYTNTTSASGGYLDRDDVDGYGPENIYWANNIPDGNYLVQVHYFEGQVVTNYQIKVTNGLGYSATYNGTLQSEGQLDDVVAITKSGALIGKK